MAMKTNPYSQLDRAVAVGIDVSKARLALCWLEAGEGHWQHEIANAGSAIAELAAVLAAANYRGKIVVESTGYFHWQLVVRLSDAGLDVRLINPLLAAKHHKAAIRKTKTDPADAFRLAGMCLTERQLPPPWRRDAVWVCHRHRVGLVRSVDRSRQQLKAALAAHRDALQSVGVSADPLVATLEQSIRGLERALKQAERQLSVDCRALDEAAHQRYASIPGVSEYLAGLMTLLLRPEVRSGKSWVAFVGLDVSVRRSGTWVGRSKLTKRGMSYLRKRLYQAAWAAKQNDPCFRAYYDTLRGQGRCYKETLLILARKLLRIAFVLQQRQQKYDRDLAWA